MPEKRLATWKWAVCAVAAAAVILITVLPGRTEPVTRERIEAARGLWQEANITSYSVDIEISGAQTGAYHVEVRDGAVSSITRDSQPANPGDSSYYTIEGLFRTIERELEMTQSTRPDQAPNPGAAWVRMRTHPELGYPVRFLSQVPGRPSGVQIRVRNLEALR